MHTPHAPLAATALTLASWAVPVLAQAPPLATVEVTETAAPFRQFQGIEVTGTAIINPTARQALPVRVIDRREIERTGATNVVELLQRLPLMHGVTDLGSYTSVGKGGYQSGAIHGHENGTLILINGRRQASVPLQRADLDRTAADIGLLPLSAIDRVEILTDGASSLYGSDATAGVVNIITRSHTPGLRISAGTGQVTTSGSAQPSLGIAWGHGKLSKDRYHLQAHYSDTRHDAVAAADLPWTNHATVPLGTGANGQPLLAYGNFSHYGQPGQIDRSSYTPEQCAPGYQHLITMAGPAYTGPPQYACLAPMHPHLSLYPQVHNRQLHTQLAWAITPEHTLFAESSHQRLHVSYPRARMEWGYITTPDNQYIVFNLGPAYPQQRHTHSQRQRHVIGLTGQVGLWDYRLSLVDSTHSETVTDTGGIRITGTPLQSLLGPFHAQLLQPIEQASPELQQALSTLLRTEPTPIRTETNQLRDITLTASRTLAQTDHGDVQLGIVGFANQHSMHTASPGVPATSPSHSARRHNHGLAAEIQWPALAQLHLTGALRAERYSDFGPVLTGKAAAKYTLTPRTLLRASAGTGFRAPTLGQMAPYAVRQLTVGNAEIWAEGNPSLRPERSIQHSVGLQTTPTPQWAFGLDWWQYRVNDTFGSLTVAEINADPELRARYLRNGNHYLQPMNLGQLSKAGIDYQAHYRKPLDAGVLTLSLEGTHHLRSQRSLRSGQPPVSDLGHYQAAFDTVTPRHKLRLSATISQHKVGWRATINHQSGNTAPNPYTVLEPNGRPGAHTSGTHPVKAYTTLDIGGWYQLSPSLRLVWNIENLTNATPPLRPYNNGHTPTTGSVTPWSDTRYTNYRGRVVNARLEWQAW
jgi:iron complex outermembrane receptor protein